MAWKGTWCERRSKSDTKWRRVFFEHACCLRCLAASLAAGSRASGAWRSEPLTSRRGDMLGHGSGGVRSHGSGFSPPFSVAFTPPTTPRSTKSASAATTAVLTCFGTHCGGYRCKLLTIELPSSTGGSWPMHVSCEVHGASESVHGCDRQHATL
jgi:hypothetical protein